MKGGKGGQGWQTKGKAQGKGEKGLGKTGKTGGDKGQGKIGGFFSGYCLRCGKYGHRIHDCRVILNLQEDDERWQQQQFEEKEVWPQDSSWEDERWYEEEIGEVGGERDFEGDDSEFWEDQVICALAAEEPDRMANQEEMPSTALQHHEQRRKAYPEALGISQQYSNLRTGRAIQALQWRTRTWGMPWIGCREVRALLSIISKGDNSKIDSRDPITEKPAAS